MRLRIVLTGILLLFSGAALAAEEPEEVYRRFHQAILGPFYPPGLFPFLSAGLRAEFDKDQMKQLRFVNKIQFMKDEVPKAYKVTGKAPQSGGKAVRLSVSGTGTDPYRQPVQMDGTVDMVNERGEWKIQLLTWGKRTAP